MDENLRAAVEKLYDGLKENYADNIRVLDQQLLALSAGTLGLSLTFIGNLVDIDDAMAMPLLGVGWLFLTGSVVAVITGLRYATRLKTVKYTSDAAAQMVGAGKYEDKGPDSVGGKKKIEKKSARIELYNKLGYWFFIVGLLALMSFVLINVLFADT